eukprot:GILI01013571.1.p1 GENE.GILI01013571.1~~GILI01013571.1.p1  ORF type:complete len:336 (-),score=66.34 GILI01013571.1:42-1049(-)
MEKKSSPMSISKDYILHSVLPLSSQPFKTRMLKTAVLFLLVWCFCLFPLIAFVSASFLAIEGWIWAMIPFYLSYFSFVYFTKAHCRPNDSDWLLSQDWLRAPLEYFPNHLITHKDLDEAKKVIFGVHPHGIYTWSIYHLQLHSSPIGRKFRPLLLAASPVFYAPVFREVGIRLGFLDASREVASSALEQGRNIAIILGGERELLLTKPGEETVVLHHRHGFCRLALSHGASLVPVYCFGLNDVYTTSNFLGKIRMWISKRFKVACPVFYGRWWSLMPYQQPLYTVVGKPIQVPKVENPSQEQVAALHNKYMAAVQALFDEHKDSLGYGDRKMVLV